MEPTVPGMGLGNMPGLIHSSGGGGRKGFLGLGGRYPTWNSTYNPITGETRTTTQGFGTTITSPDGFQRMAPRMESFGGLGGYQDPRLGGGLGGYQDPRLGGGLGGYQDPRLGGGLGGPTRTGGGDFQDMLNQFRSYQGK